MIMSVVERDDYECCGEVEGGERREALADWGWKGKWEGRRKDDGMARAKLLEKRAHVGRKFKRETPTLSPFFLPQKLLLQKPWQAPHLHNLYTSAISTWMCVLRQGKHPFLVIVVVIEKPWLVHHSQSKKILSSWPLMSCICRLVRGLKSLTKNFSKPVPLSSNSSVYIWIKSHTYDPSCWDGYSFMLVRSWSNWFWQSPVLWHGHIMYESCWKRHWY